MKTEFDAKLEINKEEVRRHAKESEDKVSRQADSQTDKRLNK
jgi:hypothetical protein